MQNQRLELSPFASIKSPLYKQLPLSSSLSQSSSISNMAMQQNSRRMHAHITVLYTLPLVKREVFGPSHINFMLD